MALALSQLGGRFKKWVTWQLNVHSHYDTLNTLSCQVGTILYGSLCCHHRIKKISKCTLFSYNSLFFKIQCTFCMVLTQNSDFVKPHIMSLYLAVLIFWVLP